MKYMIAILMAAMLSGPASAQQSGEEVETAADVAAATAAGYTIVDTSDNIGTSDRAFIDITFMKPIAAAFGKPGLPYGFGYIRKDLTGDGLDDIILVPKMAGLFPPKEYLGSPGAAVFVYVATPNGGWDLALEAGVMAIGLKEGSDGAMDIAMAQETGIREFTWDGRKFAAR